MIVSIDSEKLLPLIKAFYELSGMKIAIYDNDFCEVLTYPENSSKFCETIWQCCGKEKCDQFTAEMCRKNSEISGTMVYTCHAGLTEVISPLQENGIVFGYTVCGQVTNEPDREKFEKDVIERCKSFGIDREKLKELLSEIEYWSDVRIDAALKIAYALASYILLQKMVYITDKPIGMQIKDYIKNNVSNDLSVKAICKKFTMSKSTLYTVTKEYMPDGIANYVRDCRIKAVLSDIKNNSDKPVWKIANDTGFKNYEYFIRLFKKKTGKSIKELGRDEF